MKKLLLSAAIAAACAGSAYAQSFEFYATTETESSVNSDGMTIHTPINFSKITNGQTINIENKVKVTENEYQGNIFKFYGAEAALYVYVVNNTSTSWDAALQNSPEFSYTLLKEADEIPAGVAKPDLPQNCFGGSCWMTNPFWITCPANSETMKSEGADIALKTEYDDEAQAAATKFNRTYEYTAKLGSETLSFTLVFGNGGTASVEGIEADLNAPKEYYTLQGVKVAEPQKGSICIVKQGNKVSKQVIR